eukprot:6305804-Prymnesium_polylepis.1
MRTRCQAQNGPQALPGWFERSHLAGDGASGGPRCNGIHGGRAKAWGSPVGARIKGVRSGTGSWEGWRRALQFELRESTRRRGGGDQ